MVTHTRNLTHQSAHTAVSSEQTHTHREHTPGAVGSHLCCSARGAVGGSVPCSRFSPHWWWKERWKFTPPTYNPCRTWDSNPWPLGYKSDSLSIRPRLPPYYIILYCIIYYSLTDSTISNVKLGDHKMAIFGSLVVPELRFRPLLAQWFVW